MKKEDVTIWIWHTYLTDERIKKALEGYGGICAFGNEGIELAKKYLSKKNLYDYTNVTDNGMKYLGESGTLRTDFDKELAKKNYDNLYADESSPYRLKFTEPFAKFLGFSSYRLHLFTIPTEKTDWNIRLPLFSPIHTLKKLHKLYGIRHGWIWIDLKLNLYFCYFRKTYTDPSATEKQWYAKPFLRIPFGWHFRRMLKFADTYKKKVFVYAGDYDVVIDEVLERLKIIDKYFR